MADMYSEVVKTEHLGCCYKVGKVLEDISISVLKGDYVGIVGPNGSGKSTLIRALLGLNEVCEGTYSLFGQPGTEFDQWHRIGYLPQSLRLVNKLFPITVAETVGLGLLSSKVFPRKIDINDRANIALVLDELGISHLEKKQIGELSGGQQQRVLLARAMVNNPELLILDEPTSALDPETRGVFYDLVGKLNRVKGVTVLLVTHDTGTIGEHASKMLYLDKKILFYGSFEEFCYSSEMSAIFGKHSQHIMCHRH